MAFEKYVLGDDPKDKINLLTKKDQSMGFGRY